MVSLLFAPLLAGIANHLWQSSLFACAIALVALALRNHRARLRHILWLCASLKFLVPFSALIAIGSYLPKPEVPAMPVRLRAAAAIGRPFRQSTGDGVFSLPPSPALPPAAASDKVVATVVFLLWLGGFLSVAAYAGIRWRRLLASAGRARRVLNFAGIPPEVPVLISQETAEPGVFGVLRPTLILPSDLVDSLSRNQLDAVIAHELGHIHRRDNLWSALHMVVEAVFWFHPLVWWLGASILEDRERACDEAVLDAGCDPEAYAHGLLQVCRHYLSRNTAFVACAGGSDLKRRVAGIMTHHMLRNLSPAQRLLLAGLGIAVMVTPIAAGLAAARPTRAQEQQAPLPKFDVISIKPNNSKDPRDWSPEWGRVVGMFPSPGRLVIRNYSLKLLILTAYRLKDFQLDGARGWINDDAWNIEATFSPTPGKSPMQSGAERLPALLEDRFHLAVHRETRQLPVYTLVVAKGGPKLTPSDPNDGKPQSLRVLPPIDPTGFTAVKMDFPWFANTLGGNLNLPLIRKTGITGVYDVGLRYTPQKLLDAPDYAGSGISIFTAIQQQLGLKLEEAKGPVEVLVVDHAVKPSAN
jgi:bla regulator protein blaR1